MTKHGWYCFRIHKRLIETLYNITENIYLNKVYINEGQNTKRENL